MYSISNTVNRKFINSIDLSNLEIETDSGWQPITAIHKTIPYKVWYLETDTGLCLECADTHILFDENYNEIFTKDIIINQTRIQTNNGPALVTKINETLTEENMFDVTVNHPDHRFFTNGILSHNTTMLNALSYALYGVALTNIKKDNLINSINGKNMLVTVSFLKDNISYRIERGRRPGILKFYVNDQELIDNDSDESQGDSRKTQEVIEELLGLKHDMFKHIVALNTYTEPFLSMRAADQRAIIEQLLGITILSEKAEVLKEQIKSTKDLIQNEHTKIETIKSANERVQQSIDSTVRKQKIWLQTKAKDIESLTKSISKLSKIDINQEIQNHKDLSIWNDKNKQKLEAEKTQALYIASIEKESRDIRKYNNELEKLKDKKCHSCGQDLHDELHEQLINGVQESINECTARVEDHSFEFEKTSELLATLSNIGIMPEIFYDTIDEAYNHKTNLDTQQTHLAVKEVEKDPYQDQIDELQHTALQEVSWDEINSLTRLKEHQEFLLKLLTNKDSFVRKRIIDQNLAYLNARLTYYLSQIGLPHIVEFQNDLSVTITQLGQDLDFDNLSRGERNRLILSLSWAFRDVWENLYQNINLLFIDELVDSGMDASGVDASIGILKKITRERDKSIFLISHRDDLTTRVNNVLKVVKENGFTTYDTETLIT